MKQRESRKGDVSIRHEIDPATGKPRAIYTIRGRPCYRVVIDSPRSKQLAGYARIEKDLRNIADWLVIATTMIHEAELEHPGDKGRTLTKPCDLTSELKALLVAIMTTYGKLFTQAEGRRIKLEESWITDPELKATHKWWMDARNKFAAHAGTSDVEECHVVAVLEQCKGRNMQPLIVPELVQVSYIGITQYQKLHDLIKSLHIRITTKISELRTMIIDQEIQKHPLSYWKKQSEQ